MTKRVSWMGALALLAAMAAGDAVTAQARTRDTGELEPARELFALEAEKPGGLAFDGKLLWVTDRVQRKIRGLDPETGEQRAEIAAPGPWPTGLAFDGELLWVADKRAKRLFGIDTKAGLVRREVRSPGNPLGMTFDGTHLWVADGKEIHQVMREDGTSNLVFAAPPWTGSGRRSEQLGLAFHEGYLWVSDRLRDRIYWVSPQNGDVLYIMPAPSPLVAGLEVLHGRLLAVDVHRRRLLAMELETLPRVDRHNPRRQRMVLRREIANRGPDVLAAADIYVAVPVSAPNQALAGEPVFNPAPRGFVEDQWGQRFAHFEVRDLPPGERLAVTMTVDATLFAVRHHIDPRRVGSLRSIPAEIRKRYLQDATKYVLDHPSIARHLKAALGNERRPYHMVREIVRYIGENMEYELAGGWNIAPTVIDRGSGSCSEYTFVLIAMCRAAGIPARYTGAMVIRGDDASTDEVFHRWAEVWLPGYGWVPVDADAADRPAPEQQAEAFGALDNRFLITTWGGGDSRYIGWNYNSGASWVCRGRCDVEDLHIGDWYPLEPAP